MDSSAQTVILYSRIDALGDGLLRIPALRAARTAFPESRIIYGSADRSSLETNLRPHVNHLADEFRTRTPLLSILAERLPAPHLVADFRMVAPKLIATRTQLIGRKVVYEANFPGHALSQFFRFEPRPEHNAWRYHRLIERLAGRPLPFDHLLEPSAEGSAYALKLRGDDRRPLVLLGGNAGENKAMSEEQICGLNSALKADGCTVMYLHTPGAGPSEDSLGQKAPDLTVVGRKLGLTSADLDNVFLALGKIAAAYVGMEGGMGHLLASVMTPMVIVNHGIDFRRWRPLSNAVEIVNAPKLRSPPHVADTPIEPILEAVHRLFGASRRDHPERWG